MISTFHNNLKFPSCISCPILLILFFLAASLTPFYTHARIVDTENFADLLAEADTGTLVLIDIDQTIVARTHTLGSQAWWDYEKHFIKKTGVPSDTLFAYFKPIILCILSRIPEKLVEPGIPEAIKSLQERGITVWGLTGRMKNAPWDSRYDLATQATLLKLSIDFTRSPSPAAPCPDNFSHNILFTNWELKGPRLAEFLRHIGFKPKKIVFIDDQLTHLASVEESLNEQQIPFIGFHYTRMHATEKNFDPLIGNIQLKYLLTEDRILTEDEALQIKKENPFLPPNFYLDDLLLQMKGKSAILTP
jgi:hypothetical protein